MIGTLRFETFVENTVYLRTTMEALPMYSIRAAVNSWRTRRENKRNLSIAKHFESITVRTWVDQCALQHTLFTAELHTMWDIIHCEYQYACLRSIGIQLSSGLHPKMSLTKLKFVKQRPPELCLEDIQDHFRLSNQAQTILYLRWEFKVQNTSRINKESFEVNEHDCNQLQGIFGPKVGHF